MRLSLRFALIAAIILLTTTAQDSCRHAGVRESRQASSSFTSSPEIAPTCTTDTDCQQRFGGDGGPGR